MANENLDYAKLVEGQLVFAPSTYTLPDGGIIYDFNSNEVLMTTYGFKKVISIKPPYEQSRQYLVISSFAENSNSITVEYIVKTLEGMSTPKEIEIQIKMLQDKNLELLDTISTLSSSNTVLSESIDLLSKENETLITTIEDLTTDKNNLEKEVNTITGANKKLVEENKTIKTDIENLTSKKEELESTVRELTESGKSMKEDLSMTQDMVNELMMNITSLKYE